METPQAQQTSRLSQWPVQIKLVPVNAPYFDGARLLIAADCTAYAYAAFHERFIKGHITLVGCPKLDSVDYSEKLTEIIRENDIKSVTVGFVFVYVNQYNFSEKTVKHYCVCGRRTHKTGTNYYYFSS